jgi:hypothetical protein
MDKTLLSDLSSYVKTKNKYIIQSARGLIQLFRRIDPNLLKKGDRVISYIK